MSQPEDESEEPPDPLMALKHAENAADDIAYSLAPLRERRSGEVRRCYGFGGHRVLFRELNRLRAARQLVKLVLLSSADIMQCPNRLVRWHLSISKLPNYLRKSKLCCPAALNRPAATYFTSKHSDELKVWLDQADTLALLIPIKAGFLLRG